MEKESILEARLAHLYNDLLTRISTVSTQEAATVLYYEREVDIPTAAEVAAERADSLNLLTEDDRKEIRELAQLRVFGVFSERLAEQYETKPTYV